MTYFRSAVFFIFCTNIQNGLFVFHYKDLYHLHPPLHHVPQLPEHLGQGQVRGVAEVLGGGGCHHVPGDIH